MMDVNAVNDDAGDGDDNDENYIPNLGPHQVSKGMMPWWKTWRKERWVNFFFSTKKIESAKSMNLEMKKIKYKNE